MVSSKPEFGVTTAFDVMVEMRDGVRLATDIYWPAGPDGRPADGPFSVILGRTSYDKGSQWMWVDPVARYFTPRGYATVLQDLRGRGNSEGTGTYGHIYNPNEGRDGYDTIEWVAAQDWSNGRVGMVGSSHGGNVQAIAALHRPPHLSALWIDVTRVRGFESLRPGGALSLTVVGAIFLHLHDAQEVRDDPAAQAWIENTLENLRSHLWLPHFKRGESPLSLVPSLEDVYFHYVHDNTISDWWRDESVGQMAYLDRFADIPVTISCGWNDPFVAENTEQYAVISARNESSSRLIVGPWNHYTMRGAGSSAVGEIEYGADALWGDSAYNEERLRWFDRWLKDADNGVEDDAPVRLFVMGGGPGGKSPNGNLEHGGCWREETEWPLSRAEPVSWRIAADGLLSEEGTVPDAGSVTWVHDPAHPVPTLGGPVTGFYEWAKLSPELNPEHILPRARMRSVVPDGPLHQRERPDQMACRPPYRLLAERSDVVVFRSRPLDRHIEVTGAVEIRLWVASSAVDTDFTVKLIEEHPRSADWPEGFHMQLADTIQRMRFREGYETEVLMEPGTIYQITLRLPPISNRFAAGHRIRLDVASSNFPRFDINPNTGEPLARHTHTVLAHNTLFFGGDRPSFLTLPVIPAG